MELRRDAYLTESGHKRPGIRAGMAIKDAEAKAEAFTSRIDDHKN